MFGSKNSTDEYMLLKRTNIPMLHALLPTHLFEVSSNNNNENHVINLHYKICVAECCEKT